MEVEKTLVRNTYDYLENIAAAFFEENRNIVKEEVDGRYGFSEKNILRHIKGVISSDSRNYRKKKSETLVQESAFSPIFVPSSQIHKH